MVVSLLPLISCWRLPNQPLCVVSAVHDDVREFVVVREIMICYSLFSALSPLRLCYAIFFFLCWTTEVK